MLAEIQSNWNFHTLLVGVKTGTTVWEKGLVWQFLMKLNICLRPNYLL